MDFQKLGEQAPAWRKYRDPDSRVLMIKELCFRAGIRPFVAPLLPAFESFTDGTGIRLPSGAISHPELNLRTTDPDQNKLIRAREQAYLEQPYEYVLGRVTRFSYGTLLSSDRSPPPTTLAVMAKWYAAFVVLKSDREKKWWAGDGLHLANIAKALGLQNCQGNPPKPEVIAFMRRIPEALELEAEDFVRLPTAMIPGTGVMAVDAAGIEFEDSVRCAKGSRKGPDSKMRRPQNE